MSNRTWVCLECEKSYRRDQAVPAVACALCRQPCEYVHWKIRIPSPRKQKEWRAFWLQYRTEKRLLAQYYRGARMKSTHLPLLNKRLPARPKPRG